MIGGGVLKMKVAVSTEPGGLTRLGSPRRWVWQCPRACAQRTDSPGRVAESRDFSGEIPREVIGLSSLSTPRGPVMSAMGPSRDWEPDPPDAAANAARHTQKQQGGTLDGGRLSRWPGKEARRPSDAPQLSAPLLSPPLPKALSGQSGWPGGWLSTKCHPSPCVSCKAHGSGLAQHSHG